MCTSNALKPARLERVDSLALPSGRAEERVARQFTGWINLPAGDVYEFALSSDDGSRLLIGGSVVIDNDGLHSSTEKRAAIALAAGTHTIAVQHFNKTGGAECTVRIAPAGQPLQPIDPVTLLRIPP